MKEADKEDLPDIKCDECGDSIYKKVTVERYIQGKNKPVEREEFNVGKLVKNKEGDYIKKLCKACNSGSRYSKSTSYRKVDELRDDKNA